jgi:hypothetical protein
VLKKKQPIYIYKKKRVPPKKEEGKCSRSHDKRRHHSNEG